MAYVTARGSGRFEIRESVRTDAGPRARTLATFTLLTDGHLERALARATTPLDPAELRRAALRAGARVEASPADAAAAALLSAVDRGATMRPALRRLVAAAADAGTASEAERAAGAWLARSPEERGRTLVDLLDLADALPQRRRRDRSAFPRL